MKTMLILILTASIASAKYAPATPVKPEPPGVYVVVKADVEKKGHKRHK
jgi:hypothetical protein